MFWLDTTILALLALGALLGAVSGFLWQVARIASLALAIYAAILLNEWASALLSEAILQGADPRLARGLAYLVVFLVVFVVLYQVIWLLDQWIQAVNLEPLDRLLGAMVGALKMGLLLAAICLGLTNYPHAKTKEVLDKSSLAPVLASGMDAVLVAIPEEYKNELTAGWNHLRELARNRAAQAPPQEAEAKTDEKKGKVDSRVQDLGGRESTFPLFKDAD